MYSISLFVATMAMVFLYRAQHPANVVTRAGLQLPPTELARNPVYRLARRTRLALGLIIAALSITTGYRIPIEIGAVLSNAQNRTIELQNLALERRLASESRHAALMINALGGADNYLAYLSRGKNVN